MERPDFSEIKDFDEFCKYYWYREELIKICKELGLKASGSKIEMNLLRLEISWISTMGRRYTSNMINQHFSGISL